MGLINQIIVAQENHGTQGRECQKKTVLLNPQISKCRYLGFAN